MGWYKPLRLVLFLACVVNGFQGVCSRHVAENSNETLTYPSSVTKPSRRYWYKGTFYGRPDPPPSQNDALFIQPRIPGVVVRNKAPPRMTVSDSTTCDMVITGVQLEDSGNFSTATEDPPPIYAVTYEVVDLLEVYIQPVKPEIQTVPSDLTNLKENDVLTVICTVPRLYPEVEEASFQMMWKKDMKNEVVCPGDNCDFSKTPITGDLAKEYKQEWTKTLNSSDDGASVVCSMLPAIGVPVMSNPLNLQVQSNGPRT